MSHYRLTAAAIMTLIIGGGLLLYEPPKPAKVERPKNVEEINPVHGFGVIDLEEIRRTHPSGDELKELRAKEIRLRLELNEVLRPVFPPKLPEIDMTPFEESARERNMQNVISQLAAIKARKKRLTEEYRKSSEPDYLKRRNAVHDFYLNEAFNITLKMKNADLLHLTQEQLNELQQQMDQLVIERNQKQAELLNAWVAEINDYVDSQTAEDEARIRQEANETLNKYSEEAVQKIRETQARNRELMEAATREIAFRQVRRREILAELTETSNARAALEDKILSSIVDEAGKLGALYRLEMVLIRREFNYAEEHFLYNADMNFRQEQIKSPGAIVIAGKDTRDLTRDLLRAVRF